MISLYHFSVCLSTAMAICFTHKSGLSTEIVGSRGHLRPARFSTVSFCAVVLVARVIRGLMFFVVSAAENIVAGWNLYSKIFNVKLAKCTSRYAFAFVGCILRVTKSTFFGFITRFTLPMHNLCQSYKGI